MHAYIVLSLLTGLRTEEARALRWAHVDLTATRADPPSRPAVAVWRSVRTHGDTKTERSRRTLGLPQVAVQRCAPGPARPASGSQPAWQEHRACISHQHGRRAGRGQRPQDVQAHLHQAGAGRGLDTARAAHTFVRLLSHRGVSIEEIARLAGHASTRTTEIVYRRELRPVITTGAEAMDRLFPVHVSR